ncbi:hypothetical protein BGW36DRAFT_404330 [Talaromyces proteolyticus]|uniref:Uncharacterized protein n=1 Tax=Talaromyces proteolyticus TaxID=1131652 RepID=A0AAD4KYY2_9EURO|nr:uncharacterized protein BGW36DRAFT_404330 [Talaromyces proteolyticus]KAH8704096.1 hypothetical protein BGW36DRAFT_404330 [Talaromyces proteolyticus]
MEMGCPPIIRVSSDSSEPSSESTTLHPKKTTQRPLAPREYAEAILFHSKQTIQDTVYPGDIFEDLGLYLKNGMQNGDSLCNTQGTLHTIDKLGGHSLDVYSSPSQCAGKLEEGKNSMKCHILFLHGYPSPQWISTVGAFCRTDPQFFHTHLRFRCRRDYYSTPTLRSGLENIITLRFVTLGSREERSGEFDQGRVDALRLDSERNMTRYKHDLMLGSRFQAGDSIVRSFSVLDEKNFFIEQEMSICLHKHDEGWIILVATDSGRDLSRGPQGPWLPQEDGRSYLPWTIFAPTIQHNSRIWTKSYLAKPTTSNKSQEKFPQSAQLLALYCGETLDTPTMVLDPFYAITDLFQFCAFSEIQFMNVIEAKIEGDTDYNSLMKENPTLSNLLYCREIVQKHLTHLQEIVKIIKCSGGHLWPHVGKDHLHQYQKALRAKESLLEDYEQLVERAEVIIKRCSKGMNVIMNNVMLAEAKRAMVQARSVAKLTLIAFFYIPLSFTCAFFSMNIAGFEQEIGRIWLWFAVSVPVLLLSISSLVLDRRKLTTMWLSIKRRWE